jgi:hypothetical protein
MTFSLQIDALVFCCASHTAYPKETKAMSGTLTLTKASLIRLLDGVLYPNPDDPGNPHSPWGPYGPGGPVSRRFERDLSWAFLNPQPLPPSPDPWQRLLWVLLNPQPLPPVAGPRPEPWRSALMARAVIDQAVAVYRSAEILSTTEQPERAFEGVRAYIHEFVDDYCGTAPRRWPRPSPWPLTSDALSLDPLDLLVAGAQFQKAADAAPDSPLQADFSAAADQLLETGLQRMESR